MKAGNLLSLTMLNAHIRVSYLLTGEDGVLLWTGNWVTFLDSVLQMGIFERKKGALLLPVRIRSLVIDPEQQASRIVETADHKNSNIPIRHFCKMLLYSCCVLFCYYVEFLGNHLCRNLHSFTQRCFFSATEVMTNRILDTYVAGGVEIQGLHTSTAPRRRTQETPILQEMCFVPYSETDMFGGNENLGKYLRDVLDLIKVSLVSDKMDVADSSDKTVQCSKEEEEVNTKRAILLRVLQSIWAQSGKSNFTEHVRHVLEKNREELVEDQLLSALLVDRTLKSCLDVVLENYPTAKNLKVVEVEADTGQMFRHIKKLLNFHPVLKVTYIATGRSMKTMDEGILEASGVEGADWDTTQPPPRRLCGADFLVANRAFLKGTSIRKYLAQLNIVLKDGGFLLVHETTKNHQIINSLHGLTFDDIASPDEEMWIHLLRENNFEVVAQKSDGLLSTLFLCRKVVIDQIPSATVVDVTDIKDFGWVDEVKRALASFPRNSTTNQNIWLLADGEPENGIVGMINCLTKEPGGSRLR